MNLKKERELLVFTFLSEKGSLSFDEIQVEPEITGDEDFPFENTVNDLIKEGYLEQKSQGIPADQTEVLSCEITEKGKVYLKDLAQEKYEEKNKIPVYIWAVIIVVAILTFIKLFPRMFH